MAIITGKSTKIFVSTETYPTGSASENLALTDYGVGTGATPVTWTEIGNVESIGSFGDSAEVVKFENLASGRYDKLKGTSDAGKLDLSCAHDPSDAGQAQLATAATSTLMRAFKVVLPDQLTTGGTGSTYYMRGLVMNAQTKVGKASEVITIDYSTEINTNVLLVPAT